MKTLIILFLLFGSSAYGQFWKPKPKPVTATPPPASVTPAQKPEGNTQEARKLVRELNQNLVTAREENLKLKANLENAKKDLETSEKRVAEAQRQADLLREWGIARQNEAFEWMAKHEKVLDKYHHLKFVASIVGGIFGFVFGIWLMRFVPPVYGAYALSLPVATTAISAGWVWIFF
jgi:hypothetical protein